MFEETMDIKYIYCDGRLIKGILYLVNILAEKGSSTKSRPLSYILNIMKA